MHNGCLWLGQRATKREVGQGCPQPKSCPHFFHKLPEAEASSLHSLERQVGGRSGESQPPRYAGFLPGDGLSLLHLPPGARATAAAGREAGGEGESGTGGGEFAEPAVPAGGRRGGECGQGLF